MRWLAFGAGAVLTFLWLVGKGREALAKDQVACWFAIAERRRRMAKRDAAWKALRR